MSPGPSHSICWKNALPVPAAIEAVDRQSAIRRSGHRIALAGQCHLQHSDISPRALRMHAFSRGAALALISARLFDDDYAVHVRVNRADIFVGARLIENESVFFVTVEALRPEDAWLSKTNDVVGLLVLVDPGYRGAHGDRQRRRLEGEVLDVDLGRSGRDLLRRRAAGRGQQRDSASRDQTPSREKIAHVLAFAYARVTSVTAAALAVTMSTSRMPITLLSCSVGTLSGAGAGPWPAVGCGKAVDIAVRNDTFPSIFWTI